MKEDTIDEGVIRWAIFKGKEVHIDDIDSGKKGYTCIQCNKELVAHKGESDRTHHFKHYVKGAKNTSKCPYKDKDTRHSIAQDLICELKFVHVPILFKLPPEGRDGSPKIIHKAQKIKAHKVLREHTIYEDSMGNIKIGKFSEDDENSNGKKHLLVRPDIIFLDDKNKPILLIELYATHKVDEEKQAKLLALGINAIEIKVPIGNKQTIREAITQTHKTHWLYHQDYERTNYDDLTITYTRGNESALDEQRRLFSEGINCRKARIRNVIQYIEQLMETAQFRERADEYQRELQRVTSNTKRERTSIESNRKTEEDTRKELTRIEQSIKDREDALTESSRSDYAQALQDEFGEEERKVEERLSVFQERTSGAKGQFTAINKLRKAAGEEKSEVTKAITSRNAELKQEGERRYSNELHEQFVHAERVLRAAETRIKEGSAAIESQFRNSNAIKEEIDTKQLQLGTSIRGIKEKTRNLDQSIRGVESRRDDLSRKMSGLEYNIRDEFQNRYRKEKAKLESTSERIKTISGRAKSLREVEKEITEINQYLYNACQQFQSNDYSREEFIKNLRRGEINITTLINEYSKI